MFINRRACPFHLPSLSYHPLLATPTTMGGNIELVAGYGQVSLGQAVNIAQNSDGGVDQRLAQFLEKRLAEVWAKLNAQPTSYILPQDEFALLNYYRSRFGDSIVVRDATKRFWDNHKGTA